jgi:tetratricopeptide (TPR) repeat protein
MAYFNGGDYPAALKDYSVLVNRDPANPAFMYGRGYTYLMLEKYGNAIEDFSKVIDQAPLFADAYNNRGVAFDRSDLRQKALSDYLIAISLSSNSQLYMMNAVSAALNITNALATAERYVRNILIFNPTNKRARIYFSTILINKKEYIAAEKLLLSLYSEFPDENIVINNLCTCYHADYRYDKEVFLLEKHIGHTNNNEVLSILPGAYSLLSGQYNDQGQYAKALYYCNRSLAMRSNDIGTYYLRAVIHLNLGDQGRYRDDMEKAGRLECLSINDYYLRANALSLIGYYSDALQDISYYCSVITNDAAAFSLKGSINFDLKKYQDSIIDRQKALIHGASIKEYYFIGGCYVQLNNAEGVISNTSIYISEYPDDAAALSDRGLAYFVKSDYRRALSDYSSVIRIDKNNDFAHLMRGQIYFYLNNPKEAVNDLRFAIQFDNCKISAGYNLGRYYEKLSNWASAKEYYKICLTMPPKPYEEKMVQYASQFLKAHP